MERKMKKMNKKMSKERKTRGKGKKKKKEKRGIEAIFEFHPKSRDISRKPPIFGTQFDPTKTPKCAPISASRMKFKIAPERIHTRGLRKIMSLFGPRV